MSPTQRHRLLLHRLEQRALNLRRRPIDFVGQHDVREDRPSMYHELEPLRIVNQRARDVGWQQVWCELNPLKRQPGRTRRHLRHQRLGQARQALYEHVARGEQADEDAVDGGLLADHRPPHLLRQLAHPGHGWGDRRRRTHSRTITKNFAYCAKRSGRRMATDTKPSTLFT